LKIRAREEVTQMGTDRKILNSWKEIASYMGRGVRTVQRWERHFHLPVHRPAGHDRSAVIAFSDEVDDWLASTPIRIRTSHVERTGGLPSRTRELLEGVRTRTITLIRSAEKLQSSVIHVQEQQERRQQRKKKLA